MKLSKHAEMRMNQRGMSLEKVRFIYTYGESLAAPGKAVLKRISKRDLPALESHRSVSGALLDKVLHRTLVMDQTESTVITVY